MVKERSVEQAPWKLAVLAADHLAHYKENQDAGPDRILDVRAAVDLLEQALDLLSPADPQEPLYRYNLAIALQSRYDAVGASSGDTTDLHAAAIQLDEALDKARLNGSGQERLPLISYGLGVLMRRLYSVEQDVTALERAIDLLGDALAADDQTDVDVVDCQYEYGRALLDAGEIDDDPALLDEAVRALEALVTGVDRARADFPAYLDGAGSARLARFEARGRAADLRLARKLAEAAVTCQRSRGNITAPALSNLAKALAPQSSTETVSSADLGRAIALTREAIALVETVEKASPSGHSRGLLAGLRSNLVAYLLDEMERTNDLDDIDAIVDLADRAVADTRAGTAQLGSRAHQAAIARRTRYLRYDHPPDLAAAMSFHQVALAAPVSPTERLAIVDAFGNTLRTRFDVTRDVRDLRKAIDAYQTALAGTDPSSPDRVARLNNLGAAQSALANATRDDAAALAASHALDEAVRLGAPHSLERIRALINLGNVAAERFTRSKTPSLRDTAIGAYEEVRDDVWLLGHGTESLLQAALNAAEFADETQDWPAVVSWSEIALDAVDDLLVLQRARRSKESWLRLAQGAADRAARAAAAMQDLPTAVTLLERGRATLLREAVDRTRLDLDRLERVGGADLRRRLATVSALAGRYGGHRDADVSTPGGPTLSDLRDEIRSLPGFETFLRPPNFTEIVAAATAKSLVYLSPGQTRGIALIVRSGTIDEMVLPGLTTNVVRDQAARLLEAHKSYTDPVGDLTVRRQHTRAWNDELDAVGRWLGGHVGEPILTLLDSGPVVIIAGGLSSVLPLHAAWWPDDNTATQRTYLLDMLEISYAPSAAALTTASRLAADIRGRRLLTIADPTPTALPRLASAAAEADVAAVGQGHDQTTRLQGPDASIKLTKDALRHAQLLHAGCHGLADAANPLLSGLVLANDERLTLEQLLALTTRIRLAVLSACESGRIGTSLPDEVVSLPSGLIQAGTAGVVASNWAVPDGTTLALTAEFYRAWRQGAGERPAAALARAQAWVRDTSNGEKLATWEQRVNAKELPENAYDALQDVYLRRESDALDDAKMGAWAPFSHVGV